MLLLHLKTYIRIILASFLTLMVLRLFQYLSMPDNIYATIFGRLLSLELYGLIEDIYLWIIVFLILLVPFVLLSFIRRWIGIFLVMFIFIFGGIIELALFGYFTTTLVPLDNVVFSYTLQEILMITEASGKLSFLSFLPMVFFALLFILLVYLFMKVNLNMTYQKIVAVLLTFVLVVFLHFMVIPTSRDYFTNNLMGNKTTYFIKNCAEWAKHRSDLPPEEKVIREVTGRYQALNSDFEYLGFNYPLLHKENSEDILGQYFSFGEKRPNIVFIISESLSSCFSGPDAWFGSFTPFLDSLAGKSLYWSNCLSTSERTFGVLSSVFASAPPGDPGFIREQRNMVNHNSLIRSLKDNGYFTSFFYGGDPNFNFMQDFMKRQGINYIIDGFGPRYTNKSEIFVWGHHDKELFGRSLDILDSLKSGSRLDIYLTLSLHSPFSPPDMKRFLKAAEETIIRNGEKRISQEGIRFNLNIFATAIYADNALREFFNNYKKRKEFSNTIFIITGDHALPELNIAQYSMLEKYRVPLIIYSPLLNKPAHFRSVVSHLDITPSIMAMLKDSFKISIPENTAWLGSGLETSKTYSNNKKIAFILNNRQIYEYLNKDYFVFLNDLYKVERDLFPKNVKDDKVLESLKRELNDFKILNSWTTKNDKLIPSEMFYLKLRDSMEIHLKGTRYFLASDSLSIYRSLVRNDSFPSKIRFLKIDLSLEIQKPDEDLEKTPQIVVDVCNSLQKTLLWESIDVPKNNLVKKSREWKLITISKTLDLNYLTTDSLFILKMYIYNTRNSSACFRHPSLKVTGYY